MKKTAATLLLLSLLFLVPRSFANDINVRAYREIDFGDTLTTVVEKITKDSAFDTVLFKAFDWGVASTRERLRASPPTITLGDHLFNVYFDFYQNELYRVEFSEIPLDANGFDSSVQNAAGLLKQIMTKAKGTPDETNVVGFLDMQAGYVMYTAVWNEDSGGVKRTVGIGEVSDGAEYYADLQLTYMPLYQAWKEAQQQKRKEQINQGAKGF
jgi:hypothetical protein